MAADYEPRYQDYEVDTFMGPDEADFMIYDDGCCPFCGASLRSREIAPACDESEIYCPDCGYVDGIE